MPRNLKPVSPGNVAWVCVNEGQEACAHDGQWDRNARHGGGITRRSRCQQFRTAQAAVDIKRPAWQSMGNSGCVCVCANEHRNKAKGSVSSQSVRPCLSRCKLAARSSTALAMPAMQNKNVITRSKEKDGKPIYTRERSMYLSQEVFEDAEKCAAPTN